MRRGRNDSKSPAQVDEAMKRQSPQLENPEDASPVEGERAPLPVVNVRDKMQVNRKAVMDYIREADEKTRALTGQICETYFRELDDRVTEYAQLLDAFIKAGSGYENLKVNTSWTQRLKDLADSIPLIVKPADRAWSTELIEHWDAIHFKVLISAPLYEKTENTKWHTIVKRFLRAIRMVTSNDSEFLTDPNDPCFAPEEVAKGRFSGVVKATPMHISDFDMSKFIRTGDTQYKELSKHYDLMITIIVNYASQHWNQGKVNGPDFAFLKLVLTRLNNTIKNVESNEGRALLLEELGQLIILVKLAIRVELFSTTSWGHKDPQKIEFDQYGNVKISGVLTMDLVLRQLDNSLEKIRYDIQMVLDDRSVHVHAERLMREGNALLRIQKELYRAIAVSDQVADPEAMRITARELLLESSAKVSHDLAIELRRPGKKENWLTKAVFTRPSNISNQGVLDEIVLSEDQKVLLSGAQKYPIEVQALIVKYNPGNFRTQQEYNAFAEDLYKIFSDHFESVLKQSQKQNRNSNCTTEFRQLLKEHAQDYATLIISLQKLGEKLQLVGKTLQNLSRFSGEFELYLHYRNDMEDACKAVMDALAIARPVLNRTLERKKDVAKLDHGLTTALSRLPAYLTLFSGTGANILSTIRKQFSEIQGDIKAFQESLEGFTTNRFVVELMKQIVDGYHLQNMGYYFSQDLLFLAKIAKTDSRDLRFPYDRHRELRPFSPNTPFNQRNLGLLQGLLAEENPLLLESGIQNVLAIEAPSASAQNSEELEKLRNENKILAEKIVRFYEPGLEAGYADTLRQKLEQETGQPGLAERLKQAAEGNDEVAKLRAENRVLQYALHRSQHLLNFLRGNNPDKLLLANLQAIDSLCRETEKKATEVELQKVFNEYQERLDALKNAQRPDSAQSSTSPHTCLANDILSLLLDIDNSDISSYVRERVALKQHEIENISGGEVFDPAQNRNPDNDNNAVRKILPSSEVLQLVHLLQDVSIIFHNISSRMGEYFHIRLIQQKTSFFNSSKSPSPQMQTEMDRFKLRLSNGDLSKAALVKAFMTELSHLPFNETNIKETIRTVVAKKIFATIMMERGDGATSYLDPVCIGVFIEMPGFIQELGSQCLEIRQRELVDLAKEAGPNPKSFLMSGANIAILELAGRVAQRSPTASVAQGWANGL